MALEEANFSEEISQNKVFDLNESLPDAESGAVAKNEEKLTDASAPVEDTPWGTRMWEVFTTFWPLGFVAFGGPQAHIAILRDHLVVQRNWMDEDAFTGELSQMRDLTFKRWFVECRLRGLKTKNLLTFLIYYTSELFAIGQGLPGPTSTQLVISTALAHAGPLGGLLAFFLWNLPGLIILTTSGVLISEFIDPDDPPFWLVGLPPAAIALVFKAMYGFGAKLDKLGVILALISTCIAILINGDEHIAPTSSQYVFPSMLAAGGLVAFIDSKRSKPLGKRREIGRRQHASLHPFSFFCFHDITLIRDIQST